MKDRKLEAIRILHESFKAHPSYKKRWQQYIEMAVTEALEDNGITSVKRIEKIRTEVAEQLIDMFNPDWWELQNAVMEK